MPLLAGVVLAASLTTAIKSDHFVAELPGKWLAHPVEKSDYVEMGSYEQEDGPGFLTTSIMVFRGDAPQDDATRLGVLREIVEIRRRALLNAAGGDATVSANEVNENRSGRPSISLSYVDRRNGMVGCVRALLAPTKILTFMYYEAALPAAIRQARRRWSRPSSPRGRR